MELFEAIQNRRSIRKYTGAPVPEEKITKVLEAGRLAPSARNLQSRMFVVVKGTILEKLTEACCNQQMIKEAGTAIVVCATEGHMMNCGQNTASVDCSIAMSFMLLEAEEQGLGMCWLGLYLAMRQLTKYCLHDSSISRYNAMDIQLSNNRSHLVYILRQVYSNAF